MQKEFQVLHIIWYLERNKMLHALAHSMMKVMQQINEGYVEHVQCD